MVSAPVRRQQIAYVCQRGRSVRRACALLSVARSTVGYEPKLPQRDAPAVAVMHELAAQYPRCHRSPNNPHTWSGKSPHLL